MKPLEMRRELKAFVARQREALLRSGLPFWCYEDWRNWHYLMEHGYALDVDRPGVRFDPMEELSGDQLRQLLLLLQQWPNPSDLRQLVAKRVRG